MEPDYKKILLQFIATLAVDYEDPDAIPEAISTVLEMIDEPIEWDDMDDLCDKLGRAGVTTLYGTSLVEEFEDEEYGEYEERDEEIDIDLDDENY